MFKSKMFKSLAAVMTIALAAGATGCAGVDSAMGVTTGNSASGQTTETSGQTTQTSAAETSANGETNGTEETTAESVSIEAMARNLLLGDFTTASSVEYTASNTDHELESDLSNVADNAYYLSDGLKEMLLENQFAVGGSAGKEFYQLYETNRYVYKANFVTVDAMMHTYHMYFSYLLKTTERGYLTGLLADMTETMIGASEDQYNELLGTEWEDAAYRNMTYFSVAAALLDDSISIPSDVQADVDEEVAKVLDASTMDVCSINDTQLDYSQFKPRGYYEGDEALEKYFRAMMWYGQVGFLHTDEDLDRSALLINLALADGALQDWEEIYSVTSFFAGASDDLTYYELMPAVEAAYGEDVTVSDIAGDDAAWTEFEALVDEMPEPSINSIPTETGDDTDVNAQNKGFRFMGQRFTIDEAVFTQLLYNNVGENSDGDTRLLPDTLDVAAALGSDTALDILDEQGDTDYEGYEEQMDYVRDCIENSDDSVWSASLYNAWLYTLTPLLQEKGEGYPEFMKTEAWSTKDVETFAGSYAELKHDTVLYAKQVMAEMGGDEIPVYDDRGYVEPEVEVWSRFAQLAYKTADGLKSYGLIADEDYDNLETMAEMAESFQEMSVKELNDELLTDEEYDLIRYFGGNIEHLWQASLADQGSNISPQNYPAAIVCDIATDASDGTCLEVATGNPSVVYVLVYFDGEYHLCSGCVYSFYQFEQPVSDRLTDDEWRVSMGISVNSSGSYNQERSHVQPDWTQNYRY